MKILAAITEVVTPDSLAQWVSFHVFELFVTMNIDVLKSSRMIAASGHKILNVYAFIYVAGPGFKSRLSPFWPRRFLCLVGPLLCHLIRDLSVKGDAGILTSACSITRIYPHIHRICVVKGTSIFLACAKSF